MTSPPSSTHASTLPSSSRLRPSVEQSGRRKTFDDQTRGGGGGKTLHGRASSGDLGGKVEDVIKNVENEADEIVAMRAGGDANPLSQDGSRPSSSRPSESSPSLGTTSGTSLREYQPSSSTEGGRIHPPPRFSSQQQQQPHPHPTPQRISPPYHTNPNPPPPPPPNRPYYHPYNPNSFYQMDPYQQYAQQQQQQQNALMSSTNSHQQYSQAHSQEHHPYQPYCAYQPAPLPHEQSQGPFRHSPPYDTRSDSSHQMSGGVGWSAPTSPQLPPPAPYPYPPPQTVDPYYSPQQAQQFYSYPIQQHDYPTSQPHSRQTSSQQSYAYDPYQPPTSPYLSSSTNSPYRPVVFLPVPVAYSPPVEMARGNLAQAKLRNAAYDREPPLEGGGTRKRNSGGPGRNLPKPPAHSPHALWVGNVPSDATHAELWRFFAQRPVPSEVASTMNKAKALPMELQENLDATGVESIHLIARSNCAFVNYMSDLHLQHAILVSHGQSLRPFDQRCKDLVCRVRKKEDDNKSGVGAQRIGGMHHNHLVRTRKEEKEREKVEEMPLSPTSPTTTTNRHSTSSTNHSFSTTSTNSSFLAKYFPKRFFILKSHNEDDLKLSVERGIWATQSHNEPVLDQAFRSCKEGVYLFFSANKSGEWYGYGRMTSPISDKPMEDSSGSGSRSDPSLRPTTISEDEPAHFPTRPPMLFSPSEQRYADRSPSQLSPSGTMRKDRGESAPPTLASNARKNSDEVASKLHIPEDRRGESLDPKLLVGFSGLSVDDQAVVDQQRVGAAEAAAEQDDDGIWRKDMMPTAEERNARLEKMNAEDSSAESSKEHKLKALSAGWGKPFSVHWIKVGRLPFSRTKHIKNGFNAHREVKISRDGTEIEPAAGEQLIDEFWRDEGGRPVPQPTLTLNDDPLEGADVVPSGLVG